MAKVNTTLPTFLNVSSLFVCCIPLGIFGLYLSFQASEANAAGDLTTAASKARLANIIGASSFVLAAFAAVVHLVAGG